MSQQSSDQAAYRAGYSTEDHLLTVTRMTELCSEWRSELWLGLIDFEKAFDTVEHDVLWEVLKDQGLLKVCVKQGRATWRSEGLAAKYRLTD